MRPIQDRAPQSVTGPPKLATLVVARRGNAVLLLRRKKSPNAGLWSPPGGKLEAGEEPLAGAVREFHEETGLTALDPSLAAVVWETDVPLNDAWLMFVFRASALGEPFPQHAEGNPAWIAIEHLADMPTPPADTAILREALTPEGISFIHVTMESGSLINVAVHRASQSTG